MRGNELCSPTCFYFFFMSIADCCQSTATIGHIQPVQGIFSVFIVRSISFFSPGSLSTLFIRNATSSCQNLNDNFLWHRRNLFLYSAHWSSKSNLRKCFFIFFICLSKLNGVNRTESFLYWKEDIFIALVNKCFQCTTKTKTLRHFFFQRKFVDFGQYLQFSSTIAFFLVQHWFTFFSDAWAMNFFIKFGKYRPVFNRFHTGRFYFLISSTGQKKSKIDHQTEAGWCGSGKRFYGNCTTLIF